MNTRFRRFGRLALAVMMTTWASSSSPLRLWAIATATPTLQDLQGVAELKTRFNRDTGSVRLVLLVSPTWPVCVAGTRWVQTELLQKYPTANLRVYAVWFNMLANDSRAKWPATLLSDARVIHRWDEPKTVGTWYAARTASMRPQLTPGSQWGDGAVLWDAFLLYGADSQWDDTPTHLIHWGRTIVAGRETLREDFEKLFASNGRFH